MEIRFGLAVVAMRTYFSGYHLWSARHFIRLAGEIEDAHTEQSTFNVAHRSYITSALLCTAGFLEAAINELFDDAVDRHMSFIKPLAEAEIDALATRWAANKGKRLERKPVLSKYKAALECTGRDAVDEGSAMYEDVALALSLRNALVHFHPETQFQDSLNALSGTLQRRGFPSNRLMEGSGNSYFPDHCLGVGCATWAQEAARAFADEFFGRLGVTPHYQLADFGEP